MRMQEQETGKGLRYNQGKRKWSYVHFGSLEPMIEVLEFGAKKYAPFNWMKGLDKQEILESMQRHLGKLFDGEANDPETGISHMGHIQCNAMFYNYMLMKEKEEAESQKAFVDIITGHRDDIYKLKTDDTGP